MYNKYCLPVVYTLRSSILLEPYIEFRTKKPKLLPTHTTLLLSRYVQYSTRKFLFAKYLIQLK